MRKPPKQAAKKDALGRRQREIPVSSGKRIVPHFADIIRFMALNRHGDLPSTYLHEFTKHMAMNEKATRYRLRDMFHEKNTPHNGTYLDRDPRQWATKDANYNFVVYRMNKRSEALLKQEGLFRDNTPKTSSSWTHDFLRACYSASMELECLKEPDKYEYVHHDEIMDKIGDVTFEADGERFSPDLIHGIRYLETGATRLFMVEIDCNTEQGRSTKKNRDRTFQHKLEIYKRYIGGGAYKQDFGISGGVMLVVLTTNETHMHNLIEIAEGMFGTGSNYILFNYVDGFGYYFEPPRDTFPLFNEPWLRAGRVSFLMSES